MIKKDDGVSALWKIIIAVVLIILCLAYLVLGIVFRVKIEGYETLLGNIFAAVVIFVNVWILIVEYKAIKKRIELI